MRLIVGLGNPGQKYVKTRHNVGFMTVDAIAKKLNLEFRIKNAEFKAEIVKTPDLILVKPQTFMNQSGLAVKKVMDFYHLTDLGALYVIHDDLDIKLGQFKIQLGKGPKIHNGLLSIYEQLGSDQFYHVRVGVDNRQGNHTLSGADYVLDKFTEEEKRVINNVIPEVVKLLSS